MGPLLSVASILEIMLILLEICSFNHIKTVAEMFWIKTNPTMKRNVLHVQSQRKHVHCRARYMPLK